MKKILILSLVFLSTLIFNSCTQEAIPTYNDTDNIYFSPAVYPIFKNGISGLTDFDGFSFGFDNVSVTKRVYKIPIRVQGNVKNVDRIVKVSVDPSSTAKEGTHFTLPQNIVFRAGRVVDTIAVTFNRTPDMKVAPVYLLLRLEENDQFTTKMKTKIVNTLTGQTLSYTSFGIDVNDILSTPIGWYAPYLGVFTTKKLFLMCNLMHLEPVMFNQKLGSPGLNVPDYSYYRDYMKRYLADQAAAGNIIYEDDGTKMLFP